MKNLIVFSLVFLLVIGLYAKAEEKTFDVSLNISGKEIPKISINVVGSTSAGESFKVICNSTGDGNISIYRDGEDVTDENDTYISLPKGEYEYVCNITETENYTSASTSTKISIIAYIVATLSGVGNGVGSLLANTGAPLVVFMILISVGGMVGIIVSGIGKRVGTKI